MKCTTLDLKAITLFWFQTQKHAPFTPEGFQGLVPTSVFVDAQHPRKFTLIFFRITLKKWHPFTTKYCIWDNPANANNIEHIVRSYL